MAQLNWTHDYETETTSFEIDNLRYETNDGGQNIRKYIDGEYSYTLRQFPEEAEDFLQDYLGGGQFKECPNDEWPSEMIWLVETYPEQLGEFHRVTAYRDRNGNIVEHDRVLGYGANNLDDLIPINRLGQPASIQERWGFTTIAISNQTPENAQEGIEWVMDNTTNKIYRIGAGQCYPCHVYPKVYKPVEIPHGEFHSDVTNFNGTIYNDKLNIS